MERLLSPNKVVGIKQVRNVIIQNKALVVYLAEDVTPGILDEVVELCAANNVKTVSVVSRRELARLCKIDVPCAAAAVLNDNLK